MSTNTAKFHDHTAVADTAMSEIKESVSLQKNAWDNTIGLGGRNLAKNLNAKNIVSLATQLSQNKKIVPGKVIADTFIPASFVLPSVYKNF